MQNFGCYKIRRWESGARLCSFVKDQNLWEVDLVKERNLSFEIQVHLVVLFLLFFPINFRVIFKNSCIVFSCDLVLIFWKKTVLGYVRRYLFHQFIESPHERLESMIFLKYPFLEFLGFSEIPLIFSIFGCHCCLRSQLVWSWFEQVSALYRGNCAANCLCLCFSSASSGLRFLITASASSSVWSFCVTLLPAPIPVSLLRFIRWLADFYKVVSHPWFQLRHRCLAFLICSSSSSTSTIVWIFNFRCSVSLIATLICFAFIAETNN
jgi:hypothetical protein